MTRTTLSTIIFFLAAQFLTAQTDANTTDATSETKNKPKTTTRKPHLTRWTELTIGVNSTQFSAAEYTRSYADNGWQAGIIRRHQLSRRMDLSYGAMLVKVKHQTAFLETKNNITDIGERGYNQVYFRVPVDLYYQIIPRKSFYLLGGLNVNSVMQNYSAEVFTRTQTTENTVKDMWKYRETALLDLGLHVGVQGRVKLGKTIVSMAVSYNQGVIVKDMGLTQRQLDFSVSMTLPKMGQLRGVGTGYKSSPAPWLN